MQNSFNIKRKKTKTQTFEMVGIVNMVESINYIWHKVVLFTRLIIILKREQHTIGMK
jgi:hypothetical protein